MAPFLVAVDLLWGEPHPIWLGRTLGKLLRFSPRKIRSASLMNLGVRFSATVGPASLPLLAHPSTKPSIVSPATWGQQTYRILPWSLGFLPEKGPKGSSPGIQANLGLNQGGCVLFPSTNPSWEGAPGNPEAALPAPSTPFSLSKIFITGSFCLVCTLLSLGFSLPHCSVSIWGHEGLVTAVAGATTGEPTCLAWERQQQLLHPM